ncbi:MAG: C_GCAxxG_C_C family protein, partial [Lachnospiraceae bacterium]|nr:C_GCAxxG_C_C family protein [Lachnospiraceae bacterium]
QAKRESSSWAGGAKVLCGAVYSSFQIINYVYERDDLKRKAATEEFERLYIKENGSLDCRQLLASKSRNRKSCRDYVVNAADILEHVLKIE